MDKSREYSMYAQIINIAYSSLPAVISIYRRNFT